LQDQVEAAKRVTPATCRGGEKRKRDTTVGTQPYYSDRDDLRSRGEGLLTSIRQDQMYTRMQEEKAPTSTLWGNWGKTLSRRIFSRRDSRSYQIEHPIKEISFTLSAKEDDVRGGKIKNHGGAKTSIQ